MSTMDWSTPASSPSSYWKSKVSEPLTKVRVLTAVEESLQGNADQLKERSLGIAVFHRDPMYDTNTDPVVRFTAGEVRKRLAQYYSASEAANLRSM